MSTVRASHLRCARALRTSNPYTVGCWMCSRCSYKRWHDAPELPAVMPKHTCSSMVPEPARRPTEERASLWSFLACLRCSSAALS